MENTEVFFKESSEYLKTFTTIDDLLDAISEGIKSFIALYNIQNSRNIVSESLSSALHSFNMVVSTVNPLAKDQKKAILLNTLYKMEWKKARRKQVVINMLKTQGSDSDKINFLKYFGKKLNKALESNTKNRNITSHYSFCILSIYNKCFIDPTFILDKKTIQQYLTLCLTPRTRMPSTLTNLFSVLGTRLTNISQDDFLGISRKHLSITKIEDLDKSNRQDLIFFKFAQKESKFDQVFDECYSTSEKEEISLLVDRVESQLSFDQFSKDTLTEISKRFYKGFLNINNISSGIREYIKKFDENTGTKFLGKEIEQASMGYSKSYLLSIANDSLKDELEKIVKLSGVAEAFLSPGHIANLATYIVSTLISIAMETKSYGTWNRHGIPGQIRAFLLRNQLLNTLERLKLNYSYIYMALSFKDELDINICDEYFNREPSEISESYSEDLTNDEKKELFFSSLTQKFLDELDNFFASYREAIKVLPNTNSKGSLAYYLDMFAKPNNSDFSLNYEKVNNWVDKKLGEKGLLDDLENINESNQDDFSIDDDQYGPLNDDDIEIVNMQQGDE
ncbi:hypothetical protein [Francisella sp. SYW-2]|uniref:hypothetical protein n=1 Tax=Francisella sp. SYW-2 TaxID=2610886 RepID=UPI00123C9EA9|nr:hypothetical protein [Francisella sp. SYW-2]